MFPTAMTAHGLHACRPVENMSDHWPTEVKWRTYNETENVRVGSMYQTRAFQRTYSSDAISTLHCFCAHLTHLLENIFFSPLRTVSSSSVLYVCYSVLNLLFEVRLTTLDVRVPCAHFHWNKNSLEPNCNVCLCAQRFSRPLVTNNRVNAISVSFLLQKLILSVNWIIYLFEIHDFYSFWTTLLCHNESEHTKCIWMRFVELSLANCNALS